MAGVTLVVAIILAILVMTLRPCYALAAYMVALLWYPNYLQVSVGTVDFTMGRIVVLVLLLRCLTQKSIRGRFVWCRLDTWVTVSMVVYVAVYCLAQPTSDALENRGGFVMDTWFAYLASRFLVTSRQGFVSTIKCVAVSLMVLAFLGAAESVSGWRPFVALCGSTAEFEHLSSYAPRWGLNRAVGPFSHSILFGCCFAMLLPLVYYLHHQEGVWRRWAYIASITILVGAMSSMSSAPWMMSVVVIACLALEKRPQWLKPILLSIGALCLVIVVISNRPFYHVLFDYMDPVGGGGWHRARLIDLTIDHFGEWYLAGYGGKDPGWGEVLGMKATDITNEFCMAAVEYGILGIFVLCCTFTVAFCRVIFVYKRTTDPVMKSLCWSIGSLLTSVAVVWMTVSFFGQIRPLFYIVLGVVGSLVSLAATKGRVVRERAS